MKKIIETKEYTLAESCSLLGVAEHILLKRLAGTNRNGDRYYRGSDLLRVGSLMAIENFNRKMEEQNNER